MKKNHFDFRDLMQFGLFLLALLTFILRSANSYFYIAKNHPRILGGYWVAFC